MRAVAACRPISRGLWAHWCGALPAPSSYATATATSDNVAHQYALLAGLALGEFAKGARSASNSAIVRSRAIAGFMIPGRLWGRAACRIRRA